VVTIAIPSTKARGSVRWGSRTSPAMRAASHHPPKEKKAETNPPASAPTRGTASGGRVNDGATRAHSTLPEAKPQKTITPRRVSFRAVTSTSVPAATRVPRMVSAARSSITATEAIFFPAASRGTRYARYSARPAARAAVIPGSITSRHFHP
jgi:hypothetical protein